MKKQIMKGMLKTFWKEGKQLIIVTGIGAIVIVSSIATKKAVYKAYSDGVHYGIGLGVMGTVDFLDKKLPECKARESIIKWCTENPSEFIGFGHLVNKLES